MKRTLRSISSQLPTPEQIEEAKVALDAQDAEFNARAKEVDALLAGAPSTLELREEENYWRTEHDSTSDLRAELLAWANAAQSAIQQVDLQQPIWQATLVQNEHTPDLGPALDLIQQSVDQLKRLMKQAQDQLSTIVNLQVRAASQDQVAADTLERLKQARELVDGHLLERDSLPLWELSERRQMGENKESFLAASTRLQGIRAFARAAKGALVLLFLLLFLSLFGAYRLHQETADLQPATERQAEVLRISHHWVAVGLLPPLFFAYLLAPIAPLPLIGLVILVSFVPILILLPPVISQRLRILLYCLTGVYTFSASVSWLGFSPVHKREIQFVVTLAFFLLFGYLLRPARIKRIAPETRLHKLRIFAVRLVVAIVGIAIAGQLLRLREAGAVPGRAVPVQHLCRGQHDDRRARLHPPAAGGHRCSRRRSNWRSCACHHDGIARWVPRVFKWVAAF